MPSRDEVEQALTAVLDPELGINVVDLGLIYSIEVHDGAVRVAMTMTTVACPLHAHLTAAAEAAVWQAVPGVRSVQVDLVWEPPWTPAMMSERARQMLGWRQ